MTRERTTVPDRGYRVAVRELCEFAAKHGDLDHRFTASPSAQEGIAGHKIVAARRGSIRHSEFVAGRVIRTPEDKGVVYLIDDRFSRPAVRALLPEWWPPSTLRRQGVRNLPMTEERGAGMIERS